MKPKIPKPPATQRSFASPWSELDYLCQKLRYWLYTRREKTRAARYRSRLDRVLRSLHNHDSAILRAEGQAILCELNGRIADAIMHRQREIQLMERLHREADSPRYSEVTRAYMLRNRGEHALRTRRAILDSLWKKHPAGVAKAESRVGNNATAPRQIARRNGRA